MIRTLLIVTLLMNVQASFSDVKLLKDITYSDIDTIRTRMDAAIPRGDGAHPAIIMIHGGGWAGGDKLFYRPLIESFAEKGFTAFSINYRLAPKDHYPAQLDDCQRAVRFIRAHAKEYHVDPRHIGAMGDSAGGHLAALLGLRETRDKSDTQNTHFSSRIQCVVDFYGPTELRPLSLGDGNLPTSVQLHILNNFFGKSYEQAQTLYEDASPALFSVKGPPPFLIIHGDQDRLVPTSQSERLFAPLKSAGAKVSMIVIHNMDHGFLNPSATKEIGELLVQFFTRNLKPLSKN